MKDRYEKNIRIGDRVITNIRKEPYKSNADIIEMDEKNNMILVKLNDGSIINKKGEEVSKLEKDMNVCSKLGGKEIEENLCDIDGFITFSHSSDWYGESEIPRQLENDEAIVIHAKPSDAKKLFPRSVAYVHGEKKEHYVKDSIDKLTERMKRRKPINPPWLLVCQENESNNKKTYLVGHEGRHRIESARRTGINKIPVVLINRREC